ncbi:hypothetical protein GNI_113040 [Gregarina niphandrodes]|uniref:Uncharacterized protein n=1 Tax=Gregarina niphandrodes TaxID=110365 RepID=A0A023B3E6_GRENI|nr:hypothetical protein GNI_113040 [Gregarina niphandrodes]EZG55443.1 hypothetical protein GNI_113040 [Gregarina niphandrodes]|eukprot:XP_011131554.1 hypothetical protein GNI_113040 [Gregarina niphandrodes]
MRGAVRKRSSDNEERDNEERDNEERDNAQLCKELTSILTNDIGRLAEALEIADDFRTSRRRKKLKPDKTVCHFCWEELCVSAYTGAGAAANARVCRAQADNLPPAPDGETAPASAAVEI